jgi:SAM-dependent methyltransferase
MRETAAGETQGRSEMLRPAERVSKWALSQTHRHLLAITNTELSRRSPAKGEVFRVLDVGCGDGLLLIYLSKALRACWPTLRFEFYGFDVGDHGVQLPGFLRAARERLEREAPEEVWDERIALISEHDAWPYPDDFFDAIVSNQVLEHVRDQRLFFDQIARVLKSLGFSAHIYPSAHSIIEPHLKIPAAHRIKDAALLAAWIRLWSRLGVSNYRPWADSRAGMAETSTIVDYARIHVRFLTLLTNFKTQRQTLLATKESRLLGSFCYTSAYFLGKLRNVAGRDMRLTYSKAHPLRAYLAGLILRYVTSVTLVLHK